MNIIITAISYVAPNVRDYDNLTISMNNIGNNNAVIYPAMFKILYHLLLLLISYYAYDQHPCRLIQSESFKGKN